MRQLRVGNSLYMLPDDVWRQINDALGPYADDAKLIEEGPKTEQSGGSAEGFSGDGEPSGSGPDLAKPLGEDLSDEGKVE